MGWVITADPSFKNFPQYHLNGPARMPSGCRVDYCSPSDKESASTALRLLFWHEEQLVPTNGQLKRP